MMGGSCSLQRRRYTSNNSSSSSSSSSSPHRRRRRRHTSSHRSSSSFRRHHRRFRMSRFCGGSQDGSSDGEDSSSSGKGPSKRAARHSVDVEVPNQSISNFYPTDDNYQPHPTDPTLRSPKTLTDLCIDTICRSLPHLDGELPPGLPQDLVDRIVHSLTTHAALNSTTLRTLRRCELGELSLANCRGVSDEWLRTLNNADGNKKKGRPRSASAASKSSNRSFTRGSNHSANQTASCRSASSSPSQRNTYPPFVLSTHHSSSFLEVNSSMMDLDYGDDCDPDCRPLLGEKNNDAMEDCCSKSFASCSTSSFVSASSTPYYAAQDEASASPLLPSVLPPPEFFSVKLSPGSSSTSWLYSVEDNNTNNSANNTTTSPLATPSLMPRKLHPLPSTSSLSNPGEDFNGNQNGRKDKQDQQSFPTPPPPPPLESGTTSTLTLLDLRGSQRLTDRGLLQLSHTPLHSLEIVKLDNCHGITGRGLLAFSSSQKLHTLSLANCRRLTDEAVVNVSHLTGLMAVNLGGCRCLTDRSLEGLSGLLELRKLDLSQCDLITDEGLDNLRALEHIDELSLGWCRQITDNGLSILAKQPNRTQELRVLRLARCPITDEGLESLELLENLEELDLNGCIQISSAALGDTLEKLVCLTLLDVSYCPGILRSPWQGKIKALKSLELCYSGVRNSHLSRLKNLPNLEELNLDSCPVGNLAIAHLADNNVVPNLTSLDLADTDVTDAGMAKIANFPNITRLSLFYCAISNAGLRHLASMTKLEVLNLDSREIGDDGLRYLRGLPLKSLDIFSGRVTDIGCAHLSKIGTLTSLELCGGGIGDLGCAHLAKLSNLTSLNLSQNERITNRGAASLAALTNLKALNLSNTCVNSLALKFLSGLVKLQSLALYGCKDMEDSPGLNSLQSELPSLRCLRLNSASDEDGVINHVDSEDDNDDEDDEDDEEDYEDDDYDDEDEEEELNRNYHRRLLRQSQPDNHHNIDGSESSFLSSHENMSDTGDFEDARNDEIEGNANDSNGRHVEMNMEDYSDGNSVFESNDGDEIP